MASVSKPPPGQFTVLYFAAATSHTKSQHDFLPAPMPVAQLWDALDTKYPGFKTKVLESAALTVNLDYVDLDEEAGKGEGAMVIQAGDEVGVIPPVSSGTRITAGEVRGSQAFYDAEDPSKSRVNEGNRLVVRRDTIKRT
ncbi:uncharacterized protein LTR77_008681 [Saxophila tyrrhenica]|uniref:Molybdopterin synthase sulfur carrier subunit n=1 Tax=Saxophila tyrrhenica TaxID=1690608 RepID=A0AAV9NZT4_9PEZI|nr:hypothetical protein LTR77_008681 [Saxophila tyrrhenica]